MITKQRFNKMFSNNDEGLVSKSEMIEKLKTDGSKLSDEGTRLILKEYFDVKQGDTILTPAREGTYPNEAARVLVDGKEMRMFTLYKVGRAISIDVSCSRGRTYSGLDEGSGIFLFFIDKELTIIRPRD